MMNNVDKIADAEGLTIEETAMCKAAHWIMTSSAGNRKVKKKKDNTLKTDILDYYDEEIIPRLKELNLEEDKVSELRQLIENTQPFGTPQTKAEKVYADSRLMDLMVSNKGKKRIKEIYEELTLSDVELSRGNWYDMILNYLSKNQCYTDYGHTHIRPGVLDLISKIEKEKKQLKKQQELLVQKELAISEAEMKELKKNLRSSQGRDGRGIQTLFRTTSKNHYTLNEMVDRKASIMITVNSIILSLIVGRVIGGDGANADIAHALPIMTMAFAAMGSIFFAVLAIRPSKTHGKFTEEEIRSKSGNVLYFGNVHNMHLRDYEWAMLQMLNDSDFLYGTMIKDIYYLGVSLHKKYFNIRWSLNIFLFGLALAFLVNILVHNMGLFAHSH